MESKENLIIHSVNTDAEESIECVPDINGYYENHSSLLYEEPIPDKNNFMKLLSNGSSAVERELIQLCDIVGKKVDEEVGRENHDTNRMTSIDSETDDSKFFMNKIFSSSQGYSTTNSNVESTLVSSKKCSYGENSKVKENGFKEPVDVSERKRKSDSSTKRKESQKSKVSSSNVESTLVSSKKCSNGKNSKVKENGFKEPVVVSERKRKSDSSTKRKESQKSKVSSSNVESTLVSSKKCSNGENSKVKENGFKEPVVVSERKRKSASSTKRKESQKSKVNTTANGGMDDIACSSKTLTEAEKIIARKNLKSKKASKTVKNSKTNVVNKRKKFLQSSGSFANDKHSVTVMKKSRINLSSRNVINIRKKSVRRSLSFTSDISSVESETSQDKVLVISDKEKAIIHCKNLRVDLIDIFKYPQDFFKEQLQENGDLSLVNKFIKTSLKLKKASKTVKNLKTNVINNRKKYLQSSGSFTNDKISARVMKSSKTQDKNLNIKGLVSAVRDSTIEEAGVPNQVASKPMLSLSEEFSETLKIQHMDTQRMDETRVINREETISASAIIRVIQQQNTLIQDLVTTNERLLHSSRELLVMNRDCPSLQQLKTITRILERIEDNTKAKNNKL